MIEVFELELLGGGWEKRYRSARPEIDRLPWGTLGTFDDATTQAAREHWTMAAYQEHATAAICGEMLRLLVACRAPLDLVACAAQFPLDELVHVELCARICGELGGGVAIQHDPRGVAPPSDPEVSPLLAAAELAIRVFCVGEAFSVPIIAATQRATVNPLARDVLSIILRDEAPHGAFGWAFLDWASAKLEPAWRSRLREVAREAIAELEASVVVRGQDTGAGAQLGWLEPSRYRELARTAIDKHVRAPLRARGL